MAQKKYLTDEERLAAVREYKRQWKLRNAEKARAYNASAAGKAANNERNRRWREANRDRKNTQNRAWRNRDIEHARAIERASVMRNGVEAIRRNQWKARGWPMPTRERPERCECCGGPPAGGRGNTLHLDHDHATGEFRGWLCGHCNHAIGKLGDGLRGVLLAARYLARFYLEESGTWPDHQSP